jgi:heme-degrading monooxygenase HmoA
MIARIWTGRTKIKHLEDYTAFMKDRAIPDYKKTKGFVKLIFLKRTDQEFAYFDLITFWENLEVIKNFAGEDFEKAKYYPEDSDYLIDFPEKVTHYDVFAETQVGA